MRYSTEPRDRIHVKGYGFLSFAKNLGKNLRNKYGQKLFDNAKNLPRMQFYMQDCFKKSNSKNSRSNW